MCELLAMIATQPLTEDEQWYKMLPKQWQLFYLGNKVKKNKVK